MSESRKRSNAFCFLLPITSSDLAIRVDSPHPSRQQLSESTALIRVDNSYPSRQPSSESTAAFTSSRSPVSKGPGQVTYPSHLYTVPPYPLFGPMPLPQAAARRAAAVSLSAGRRAAVKGLQAAARRRLCAVSPAAQREDSEREDSEREDSERRGREPCGAAVPASGPGPGCRHPLSPLAASASPGGGGCRRAAASVRGLRYTPHVQARSTPIYTPSAGTEYSDIHPMCKTEYVS